MTSAHTAIKIAFNFAAEVARDFFLRIVNGLGAVLKMP
jgi:hypothetical protein